MEVRFYLVLSESECMHRKQERTNISVGIDTSLACALSEASLNKHAGREKGRKTQKKKGPSTVIEQHPQSYTPLQPSAQNETRVYVPPTPGFATACSHLVFFRHAGAAPEAEERVVAGAVQWQRVLDGISSPAAAAPAPESARVVPAVGVIHIQGQEVGPRVLPLLVLRLMLVGVTSTTTAITTNAGSDSGATHGALVAAAATAAAWAPTAAVRSEAPREARKVSVVQHERLELPQERRRDLHLRDGG